jgi:Methyltransferase domain
MFAKLRRIPDYLQRVPEKLRLAYKCVRSPYFRWVAPGHFYSPLPDMEEVARRMAYIYPPTPSELPGIDLHPARQGQLLGEFEKFYADRPFDRSCNPKSRFFWPNGSFPFQDAFTLYGMIRHLKPARFVEAGCGMSSCVILDTLEALKLSTRLTLIEPYPEFLLQLIQPADRWRFELKQQCIQDVPLDLFARLEDGDILFIDTSHSSKIGSDVNHIFFQILPLLKKGVYVHFHDIWYPFEYPADWLQRGMFWNEAYLLRAFLMFNPDFEIVMFNNYVFRCMSERVKSNLPLFCQGPGASIWLRRT